MQREYVYPEVGDRLSVVMNDRKESLQIVGIGLSPEYVYMVRGAGELLPDDKHFTILWCSRSFTESAFGATHRPPPPARCRHWPGRTQTRNTQSHTECSYHPRCSRPRTRPAP